ncbi:MAG: TonB family protein [Longimicrobiales bacterium]
MITAWMAYAFLVGAFAGGAAWVLERVLRSHRLAARWVWAGGMVLSGLWPVWTVLRPEAELLGSGPPPGPPLVALEPLTLQVGTTSVWMALDGPLVAFWILSSSLLLLLGLGLLLRTRRLRRRWSGESAAGREVLVSEDWGPAVVGLLKPQIVLPRWCHGMDEEGLRLILDHEAEHMAAGDLRLLVLAGAFPVLFPWSLPAWWMWHRLRLAVEGDCDLRVLKRNPRATRAYLELLLQVGQRLPQGRAAAAMLSEPERTLARRIRTMTMPIPKRPLIRGTILVAVGGILIAVACAVPTPLALDDDTELPAIQAALEKDTAGVSEVAGSLLEEPTFTPFTVRPDVLNRDEVAAALEAEYPPLLREAGIGGTVNVWIFLDETGTVRKSVLNETSGHKALDDAALEVADVIRFTAALNRDQPVPVWISIPITFMVPESEGRPEEEPGDADEGQAAEVVQNPNNPTPVTQAPVLQNREEVLRAVWEAYPPELKEAGKGGTVDVWFYLSEEGRVMRTLVNGSSGSRELDDAAIRIADVVRFSPAMNGDTPVPVWISFPVQFQTGPGQAPPSPPRAAAPIPRSDPGAEAPEATSRNDTSRLPAEPGPEAANTEDLSESPTFTPFTVRPDIKNRADAVRAIGEEYPPLLRDAGVGGTAQVWLFIDETGRVQRVLLNESSGHDALDEAALRVARQIDFTPARNRDKPVPVWISIPITFTTR